MFLKKVLNVRKKVLNCKICILESFAEWAFQEHKIYEVKDGRITSETGWILPFVDKPFRNERDLRDYFTTEGRFGAFVDFVVIKED